MPQQRAEPPLEPTVPPVPTHAVAHLSSRYSRLAGGAAHEVTALRCAGWNVAVFALESQTPAAPGHSAPEVTVLRDDASREFLRAALRAARTTPVSSALRTLLTYRRPHGPGHLRVWLDAATLLAHLDARGLTHIHVHLADEAAEVARRVVELDGLRAAPRSITWSLTLPGLQAWPTRPGAAGQARWRELAQRIHSATGVVTGSEVDAAELASMGAHRPVEVIRPGVDPEAFRPSPVGYRPSLESGEPFRILTVGPLVEARGLDRLLQAMGSVPRVHLTVVGEGPAQARLRMLAAELRVAERVTWFRSVRQEDIQAIYRGSDAIVAPEITAGVPISLLEGMACGLPVVAPATDALVDLVVDGENGVLAQSSRPADLATALRRMACDISGQLAMGRSARRRVEQDFTLSRHARAVSAFLSQVSGIPQPAGAVVESKASVPAWQSVPVS